MKTLTLQLFLCAFLALYQAAVVPEAEDGNLEDTEVAADHVKQSCSWGWSQLKGRCLRFFSTPRTWAQAECLLQEIPFLTAISIYNNSLKNRR
ncbi:type-2 ice-structuring protein-like [Anableps anableps]